MSTNTNDTAVTALLELGDPNNSDEGLTFSEELKQISSDLDAKFAPYREQLQKESTGSQSESSATTGNKKRKAESTGSQSESSATTESKKRKTESTASQSESSATTGNKMRKAILVLRKKKTTSQSEFRMEWLENFPGNPENYNFSGGTGGEARTATYKTEIYVPPYIPTKIGAHFSRVGGWV